MAIAERQIMESGGNATEMVAGYLTGGIEKKNLSENNQFVLEYHLGLMADNSRFREEVDSRVKEIVARRENGRKIPLFTEDELANAKGHKKKRKKAVEGARQLSFLQNEVRDDLTSELEKMIDPEKGLNKLHRESQSRFEWNKNSLIIEEIKRKKLELRELIGLPVARGKNKYVKNDFYKYLVKRIVTFDTFGIFNEFDRAITETPSVLDLKINEVKKLVNTLLHGELNFRDRYQAFNRFSEEYRKKNSK